jgi:hypothetical protein
MAFFKKNFVVYNGFEMAKGHPADIIKAQSIPYLIRGRWKFHRYRYGEELGGARVTGDFRAGRATTGLSKRVSFTQMAVIWSSVRDA